MTTRLYYHDAYRTSFEAVVRACHAHGDRVEVLLDQTAFYPTSGGQPFDRGTLGEAVVHEVIDDEGGEVRHIVDRPLAEGAKVVGQIDWTRRFDHMQQHTGQHVLSAAFDRLFSARTESFHLGAQSASIDLGREVSADMIAAAEDEANRVVWEDRPVNVKFVSAEEAASLPLRKPPQRSGALRLVEVEDFDLSACGGTHVARTGAIGIIAALSWEKFRGGTRVEFVCGSRALTRFREWRSAFASTMRHLSVPPGELAAAIERLQLDVRTLQKTIRGQQERLAVHEARTLAARAERFGERLVLVEALEEWDAAGLKALASAVASEEPRAAVALFSRGTPSVAVIAAGASSGVDAAAVLKSLTSAFGGRGGGRRELAQGGGFNASVDELTAAARKQLQN